MIHFISTLVLCLAQFLPVKPCQNHCGEAIVDFPFGIGEGCYLNKSFELTCDYTYKPPKLFFTSINMEYLKVPVDGQVQINNPILYSNCKGKPNNRTMISLEGSPFVFSNDSNRFTATGCNNYAMLVDQENRKTVGGCFSICRLVDNARGCYGVNCCQATIPPYIQSFEAKMIDHENNSGCKSAFMVDQDWFASRNLEDLNSVDHVPAVLDWAEYQGSCYINPKTNFVCTRDGIYCWKQLGKNQVCICNGCNDSGRCTDPSNDQCNLYFMHIPKVETCRSNCGDTIIRFPFGIGKGCYLNENFNLTCNETFKPPKLFLTRIHMEYLKVSKVGTVQVHNPILYRSYMEKPNNRTMISLVGSPFVFSNRSNRFTAIGCNNYAILIDQEINNTVGGCSSICNASGDDARGCYGINCCQATIPPYKQSFEAKMIDPFDQNNSKSKSAFVVDQEWFTSNLEDLNSVDLVPAVLDWAYYQGYCDISREPNVVCTRDRNYCWKILGKNQVCICNGCEDFGGCIDPSNYQCILYCMYTRGGGRYNCSCPFGYGPLGIYNRCYPLPRPMPGKKSKVKFIIIGCASSLVLLLFLIVLWLLYKLMKRRKALKLKQKFFKRNGGLLLQQQLSSSETNVEQTKIFTSKELDEATDHYHVNRILGQGGQGTVYKGMLTDGKVVAIKKSKVVDEDQLEQFINEVVILSQVNHRNIVKLIGCCLETEVPLLVYDFIPNGSLFQYIHNQNEEFPITWEVRLRIATEVAGALSYLHSSASKPIYHRDIKSSNILLDEKYGAKVADFGTSKSISIDQTHVTTRVHGTLGYLDPEYFQSNQFTEKSDVYSFGVVLVELLTRKKPISSFRSAEERSLATIFLVSMEENRLFEILDARIVKEGGKKEIIAVAKLAQKSLKLNGKKRPTMKMLAMELEGIRASQGASSTIDEQDYEEFDYTGAWDVPSVSTGSLNSSRTHNGLDVQPLLSN